MQILKYLFLFNFIYFCESFSLYTKNLDSFISNQKLNRNKDCDCDCDYFIDKTLYLYNYNNSLFFYINVENQRRYFWYCKVEKEQEDIFSFYKKEILEPSILPITIFKNQSFINLSLEKKYENLIEKELAIGNISWIDINKIVKKEERYENMKI